MRSPTSTTTPSCAGSRSTRRGRWSPTTSPRCSTGCTPSCDGDAIGDELDRAVLVGRLSGVRVEAGKGEQVRVGVVHREEDVAALDVRCHEGTGPELAAP